MVFIIAYFVTLALCVLVLDMEFWLGAVIAFSVGVVCAGVAELIKLMAQQNEREARNRRNAPRDLLPDEPPRPRARRKPDPLELQELTLIQKRRDGLTTSRFINCTRATEIRPYALLVVNEKKLVGRILPLKFQLVNPKGTVGYECSLNPKVTEGINRIIPVNSAMTVNRRITQGDWTIRLFLTDRLWKTSEFSISVNDTSEIAKKLAGADLEMANTTEVGKIVDQLSPQDVDDLLK